MASKILRIEDDRDMCILLRTRLGRKQFEVYAVHTGQEGIDKFRTGSYDAVLCDFKLEDHDGKDILKALKETDPGVVFVVITGYSDVKQAVEIIRMGAFDYLTKPLVPDDLIRLLERATAA